MNAAQADPWQPTSGQLVAALLVLAALCALTSYVIWGMGTPTTTSGPATKTVTSKAAPVTREREGGD